MYYANLHTHSRFSDGILLPGDLLQDVIQEKNLACFALTDHDTLSGIEPMFRELAKIPEAQQPRFIPGMEMTVVDETVGVVHLLGYFPHLTANNLNRELPKIHEVLGEYCLQCCTDRSVRDFEGRVRLAFDMNLENMTETYNSPEEIIERIRIRCQDQEKQIFARTGKDGDIVRDPIALTYQDLVAAWEHILPQSTKEMALLYCLRSDPKKIRRMAEILLEQGVEDEVAHAEGSSLQGVLMPSKATPESYLTPIQGLQLFQKAGAVTSIAHPGISWPLHSLEEFDEHVTTPLTAAGLNGIEVVYPYHVAHRAYLTSHYSKLVEQSRLVASGGTDYHGDSRTGLDDVQLSLDRAEIFLTSRS